MTVVIQQPYAEYLEMCDQAVNDLSLAFLETVTSVFSPEEIRFWHRVADMLPPQG